jgi:hypothetical protein
MRCQHLDISGLLAGGAVPSEGEKRDSKGDMLGGSALFALDNHSKEDTQQKLLCSGASVSDSAGMKMRAPKFLISDADNCYRGGLNRVFGRSSDRTITHQLPLYIVQSRAGLVASPGGSTLRVMLFLGPVARWVYDGENRKQEKNDKGGARVGSLC